MKEIMLLNFLMSMNIKENTRKAKRLAYHLPRCKKDNDRIKLTVMLVCCLKLVVVSITTINDNCHELKRMIIN